jgi:hypothetical protein
MADADEETDREEATSLPPEGPFLYDNWRRTRASEPLVGTHEVPLYSDAHITGQLSLGELGPYSLLNAVPMHHRLGLLRAPVVLRFDFHFAGEPFQHFEDSTNDSRYHGGELADEMAALVSLFLGVRMWASTAVRGFYPGGDPKGSPRAEEPGVVPSLAMGKRGLMMDSLRHGALGDVAPIAKLPFVAPKDAIAIVRAARQYQQAVWVADSQPQLSWLLLVSAVETVANRWFKGDLDPEALLREHKSALSDLLGKTGGPEAVSAVANEFAQGMKATAKFRGFFRAYAPEAPPRRPPEFAQLDWRVSRLMAAIGEVYDRRSKALHSGLPFPYPMCEPPWRHEEWDAAEEVPSAPGAGAQGGYWKREDTPMRLHTFEYLVRGALLAWWGGLPSEGP